MRYHDDDDERSGVAQAGRARQHQFSGRRWFRPHSRQSGKRRPPPPAGTRAPKAVFKISSYSHSGGALWDRANYIARDGEVAVEGPHGEVFERLSEVEQFVAEWSTDTEDHKRRALAMSAVVSFPAGVDQEQATEASRQFCRAAFAENHDYLFAPHADAHHFHVHVLVQTAGHDDTQLRITKAKLHELRELLAEKAAEQGIELDASPRKARGLDPARGPSREVEGIQRRGAEPSQARQAALKSDTAREALAVEQAAAAAATLVISLTALAGDKQKVDTIHAAAALGAVGLEVAQKGRELPEQSEEAREIIWRTERLIHENIQGIEGGEAKRAAIQATRGLSRDLTEYRHERQQRAAQARQADPSHEQAADRGRDEGWER